MTGAIQRVNRARRAAVGLPEAERTRTRITSAFSLVEVLITVVILALTLVPLLLSLHTSVTTVTGTRDYLGAVSFAQEGLEEVRRTAFRPPTQTDLTGVESLDDFIKAANAAPKNVREINGVSYSRAITLYPGSSPGAVTDLKPGQPDLVAVQIKVTWHPPGASVLVPNQEYQLFSLVGSSNQP